MLTNIRRKQITKGLAVILGLGAVLAAPSILPKDPPQYTWNFTNSVERGIYKRIEERDVELRVFYNDPVYVSFCLPIELRDASFYERFCSPDNPNDTRILKRLAAKNAGEAGGWVVRGDTEGSLDSRVLGPIQDNQVSGFWRPYFTWGSADGE
jgi:type IV secretory pathway protease TraF